MIFRPQKPALLWDTWLYNDHGQFHLFFLRRSSADQPWDMIGHAVGDDLVHWKEVEPIQTRGPEGAWDCGPTLTGMVFRHDGKYWMSFGSLTGKVERIGLMYSDDLYHWTKHPGNPLLVATGPHYETKSRPGFQFVDWRDACCFWREDAQVYEALVCARQAQPQGNATGACIARLRSKDLVSWEFLPPLAVAGPGFYNCEVPDYFEIDGTHYLLFSCAGDGGASPCRRDTPSRIRPFGTWYQRADRFEGPYTMPADPLLLGSGQGRWDCYVGRTINLDGRRLLYHHMGPAAPAWAAPKWVEPGPDRTLALKYWPGLAKLRSDVLVRDFSRARLDDPLLQAAGRWNRAADHTRLEGQSNSVPSAVALADPVRDFELLCTIDATRAESASVLFDLAGDPLTGMALSLRRDSGSAEIGPVQMTLAPAISLGMLDCCKTPLVLSQSLKLRLLIRAEYMECYLNDQWIFSTILGNRPVPGRIGFAVCGGSALFAGLEIHSLRPL